MEWVSPAHSYLIKMNQSVVMLLSQEPVEHPVLAQACIGYCLSPGRIFLGEATQERHEDLAVRVGAILCAEMSTLEAYQEEQWHFATCGQHIFLSLRKAPCVIITGLKDLARWKKTKNDQLKKVVVKLLFFQSVALIYSILSPPTPFPTFMPPTTVKPWSGLDGFMHATSTWPSLSDWTALICLSCSISTAPVN